MSARKQIGENTGPDENDNVVGINCAKTRADAPTMLAADALAATSEPAIAGEPRDQNQSALSGGAATACPPDGAEHGAVAAARLYGRSADEIWRYAIANDSTAFYVCRWRDANQQTEKLTISWFPDVGWRFGSWVSHRPLYRLPEILGAPDRQVIVCADEADADAAATIFNDAVTTCSSGGACEAAKSDLDPLAGRNVIIWMKNDEPHRAFVSEVATTLATINCAVSIIDANALAAIAPKGGVENPGLSQGPGAAAGKWSDLVELRQVAISLAKPFDPPPAYLSYGAYQMTEAGLYATVGIGSGASAPNEMMWVCGPVELLGAARDPSGSGWGKWLRWHDNDQRPHFHLVADGALHQRPAQVIQSLVAEGLSVNRRAHQLLADYLAGARIKSRVTHVTRTGWHDIGGKLIFVLPAATLGPRGLETIILEAAAHAPYETCGDLQAWRDGVATLAEGHVLPVLAISAALAGPLLSLAAVEGGGLHFYGLSSKGKTTILKMAASVWGRGGSPGYLRAWRATSNGLEGAASAASDTALMLDDVGQVDASDASAILYALANGDGKIRAGSRGEMVEPRSWRVMVVSTGEMPVETKLAEDRRRKPRAGQMVRLLDIPAERAFGVFDHSGPEGDPAKLARRCQQAAIAAYGVAGPEFVRNIIQSGITGQVISEGVAAFIRDHVPKNSDGQVDRAAQRLGLIAVAGEMAAIFGVTPWRQGEATAAAAWALDQWIAGRGGIDPAEALFAIEQARNFIERHGARFDDLDDPNRKPVCNRAGWRKGDEWWVVPHIWRTEICDDLDPVFVARVLAERGMLRRQGGDNLQCTVNVGGAKRMRAYVVTADLLGSVGPAGASG